MHWGSRRPDSDQSTANKDLSTDQLHRRPAKTNSLALLLYCSIAHSTNNSGQPGAPPYWPRPTETLGIVGALLHPIDITG